VSLDILANVFWLYETVPTQKDRKLEIFWFFKENTASKAEPTQKDRKLEIFWFFKENTVSEAEKILEKYYAPRDTVPLHL
jgi:hypothetical protein